MFTHIVVLKFTLKGDLK